MFPYIPNNEMPVVSRSGNSHIRCHIVMLSAGFIEITAFMHHIQIESKTIPKNVSAEGYASCLCYRCYTYLALQWQV